MQVARWHPWHVQWGERKESRMMVHVVLPAKGLLYRARQNNNVDNRWWRVCSRPTLITVVIVLNWWWDYTCSSDTYNYPLWNRISKPKHPFPSCFKGLVTDMGPEKQPCDEIHERRKAERLWLIPRQFYFYFLRTSQGQMVLLLWNLSLITHSAWQKPLRCATTSSQHKNFDCIFPDAISYIPWLCAQLPCHRNAARGLLYGSVSPQQAGVLLQATNRKWKVLYHVTLLFLHNISLYNKC